MKTLQEEFEVFMRMLHPEGVSKNQYDSMQMAFFAGATIMSINMIKIGNKPEAEEDKCINILQDLHKQCTDFANSNQ